ncbi:copper chaperone PCu(A)C [Roseovarius sp. SYSU LYC5161]|uniref:copper chaperone PCu(A)C n=1 Tax=Roseovarius halophilus (ex Wu et al. 2025) TaxID=3376060 RepID=UPI00399B9D9F
MTLRPTTLGLTAALTLATPAWAAEITIEDPYARAAGVTAIAGAAFMTIHNESAIADRLVAARSDVAERVELHTHVADGDVMRMIEVEEGFAIPAGEAHSLARDGDHVMFMGLRQPFEQGETITVTLTFEHAGEMTLEIPIDNDRPATGMDGGLDTEASDDG